MRTVLFAFAVTLSACAGSFTKASGFAVLQENVGHSLVVYDRDSAHRLHADDEHRRSEEHTSELQSPTNLVCRLLLEKKKNKKNKGRKRKGRKEEENENSKGIGN